MSDLAKLNRLRINAGKGELKSWKAGQPKLLDTIKALEASGFTDVVAGADVAAKPVTDDPVVAKAIAEPEKSAVEVKPAKKQKAQLARGLETEPMAMQSRYAVRAERDREAREAQAEKIEAKATRKAEKKKAKEEAKAAKKNLPKGKVDPRKDPAKAKRQEDHIKKKQEARASKPKVEKNPNDITVADIARELDIDPKVARAKLRRHEDKISKLHTKGQDRWVFPKAAKSELMQILK